MLRKDSEGITPLYREKNWNRIERAKEKKMKKKILVQKWERKRRSNIFRKSHTREQTSRKMQKRIQESKAECKSGRKDGKINKD